MRDSVVGVKRFAGKGQSCFTNCFVLGGVSVNQRGQILRLRFPIHHKFAFTDLFTHTGTHSMEPDDRSILDSDQLDETTGIQDI